MGPSQNSAKMFRDGQDFNIDFKRFYRATGGSTAIT